MFRLQWPIDNRRLASWAVAIACSGALMAPAASASAGGTIVIDPGHGGTDPGAVGNGVREDDVVLGMSRYLGGILTRQGYRVVFTRTDDVNVGKPGDIGGGLALRAAIANNAGANAFVSIHADSSVDPSSRGMRTFYWGPPEELRGVRAPFRVAQSRGLARLVQLFAVRRSQAPDRGIATANFYVLGHTMMASVLIETGYVTNPGEAQLLNSPGYQQAIATGIADGITQFISAGNQTANSGDNNESGATETSSTPRLLGTYTVRMGDTLSDIAQRFHIDETALARANGLRDANLVVAGQSLRVAGDAGASPATLATARVDGPSASTGPVYTVQVGDTLSDIAQRFHTDESLLVQGNSLRDVNTVVAGQTLRLPDSPTQLPQAMTPVPGTAPMSRPRGSYIVQPGDSLSLIAQRLGLSESALADANGLRDRNVVIAGTVLRIGGGGGEVSQQPSGSVVAGSRVTAGSITYVVQPGDTLSGIAQRFRTDEATLAQANGLANPNRVVAGHTLHIVQRQ